MFYWFVLGFYRPGDDGRGSPPSECGDSEREYVIKQGDLEREYVIKQGDLIMHEGKILQVRFVTF